MKSMKNDSKYFNKTKLEIEIVDLKEDINNIKKSLNTIQKERKLFIQNISFFLY